MIHTPNSVYCWLPLPHPTGDPTYFSRTSRSYTSRFDSPRFRATCLIASIRGIPPCISSATASSTGLESPRVSVAFAINSVISLYYYTKVVKTMFLDAPSPEDKTISIAINDFTLLIPLTVLTVLFGVYFSPLVKYTSQSLRLFVK